MNPYFSVKYNTKARWMSYWYQINEVIEKNPKNILEVGIGSKTVSNYLKKIGYNIWTIDSDKSVEPDYVGSVLNLPFKRDSFDIVLCAEVLEHLPFSQFELGLRNLRKVTKKYVILTLPEYSLFKIYFDIKLFPRIPRIRKIIKISFSKKHVYNKVHYWEIGKRGYGLSKIKSIIENNGFQIEKTYYPFENPRHRFFILKKSF